MEFNATNTKPNSVSQIAQRGAIALTQPLTWMDSPLFPTLVGADTAMMGLYYLMHTMLNVGPFQTKDLPFWATPRREEI